jgi:hypothetical protein
MTTVARPHVGRGPTPAGPYWFLEGKRKVWFCCPNGHLLFLPDYDVDVSGHVLPSVVCPTCDFHDAVQLQGWVGRRGA